MSFPWQQNMCNIRKTQNLRKAMTYQQCKFIVQEAFVILLKEGSVLMMDILNPPSKRSSERHLTPALPVPRFWTGNNPASHFCFRWTYPSLVVAQNDSRSYLSQIYKFFSRSLTTDVENRCDIYCVRWKPSITPELLLDVERNGPAECPSSLWLMKKHNLLLLKTQNSPTLTL